MSAISFIEQQALELGFDVVRATSARLNPAAFSHYEGWVTAGRAGEMAYMAQDPGRRNGVQALLPGAKSVICLGVNYYRLEREFPLLKANEKTMAQEKISIGQVARYAYGRDYHKILSKRLKQLSQTLKTHYPQEEFKPYVDTGAILEKAYAEQSGLGFIGKNTLLITPELGSWIFLAEILTTLEIEIPGDEVERKASLKGCGHCRLCLDICPTGALIGPYELDARRCISYLTIEHRGSIPVELRPLMGDWLYGCDLCQEICPHNQRGEAVRLSALREPVIGGDFQLLSTILSLKTQEEFDVQFAGSPMRRAKREGIVRNACVLAANVKAIELLPLLETLARDDVSEMVREHAAWAVEMLTLNDRVGLKEV
ncbi:MAG: hypothetical protein ACD_28C00039G0004 [uncultured bacterium]|nr:MAG: hypothetical protein ACD_28C00039G0004 [uncultured bacterium]